MATSIRERAPMHLWVVGILSLLWNGFGCYDYLVTRLRDTDYLAKMMPGTDPNAVLAYIDSFPLYAQIGWGLGVWGGLAGSLLLLLRSRWATLAFALSFIGALLGLGYQIMHPAGIASMHEGAGGVMPYVIIAVALALALYARAMEKKRVLR
ncbi:MAG: hypothetical protein ABIO80_00890 [Sphingomicrobium sp.]